LKNTIIVNVKQPNLRKATKTRRIYQILTQIINFFLPILGNFCPTSLEYSTFLIKSRCYLIGYYIWALNSIEI